jgi:hypothetical protein
MHSREVFKVWHTITHSPEVTEENHRVSLIVCGPSKIRTGYLPSTRLKYISYVFMSIVWILISRSFDTIRTFCEKTNIGKGKVVPVL